MLNKVDSQGLCSFLSTQNILYFTKIPRFAVFKTLFIRNSLNFITTKSILKQFYTRPDARVHCWEESEEYFKEYKIIEVLMTTMEMENIRVMLVRTHVSTRCPMLHVTRYPRRSPRARVRAAACWRCCRRTPPPPRARAWPAQPARGPGARCTGRTAQSRRQPEASWVSELEL